MKINTVCAIIFLLTSALGHAGESLLFHLSVQGVPVENGKTLNMTYQELSREADYSIAEVKFISGGSVSSSMFMLRGTCGVARARGQKFFHVEHVSKDPIRLRVRFQPNASERELNPENKVEKVFSVAECGLLGF